MDHCCQGKDQALARLRQSQGRVLRIVLAVNAALFGVEFLAGWWAGSTALLSDSLDMLGDALVYGFSLYVLHRSELWRVRAAQAKGVVMVLFGVSVLAQAAYQLFAGSVPHAPTMGGIGALALAGNTACFALLYRHRSDDLNLRSTWICSRNDLIANSAVLLAACAVAATGQRWPDLVIGLAIGSLFLQSAWGVLRDSVARPARGTAQAQASAALRDPG
jgi:cation diffusion facilitator family transporter